MKISTLFLFLCLFSVLGENIYSQSNEVSLNLENVSMRDAFTKIEQEAGFVFIYNEDVEVTLKKRVTIHVENKTVEAILTHLLKGTNIDYQIIAKQVTLYVNSKKGNIYVPTREIALNIETQQQGKTINGKVIDEHGEPLPGVSIVVKGTLMGTTTDVDGNYRLHNLPDSPVLVFSFVGMQPQEITAGERTTINITMKEEVIGLEEVIAIGYGTVKKRDLTGSVSRVSDKDIRNMAPTQLTESLSGTVAGLYSNQGASAAGGSSLELRGPSSLSASTYPLIVLDGVIYNGSISEINPADIETVDILKDASSSAIFGARASNGIILITTKRGTLGKPTVNASIKIGVSTTTNDFYPYGFGPGSDPMDYFRMHRDNLYENAKGTVPYYYYWHPDELPGDVGVQEWLAYSANPNPNPLDEWFNRIKIWPIEKENYLAGKTTDFYSEAIGKGVRQDYNISVGGATENFKYYWSLGYLDNEGIIRGDAFSTIRTRVNLDFDITDWLKVGTNSQFSFRDESVVQADINLLAGQSPYGSLKDEDGKLRLLTNDYVRNPLEYYYGQDRKRDINALFSSLYAEISLPFGIMYKVSYQPSLAFTKDFNFWSSDTYPGSNTYKDGFGQRDHTNSYSWMFDNLIKWNRTFGAHDFDVTLLANAEKNQSWFSRQSNSVFAPNQNLIYHALQFGAKPGLSNSDVVSTGDALMARLNYTLLNRYLFTASVRRDGYSAFGQDRPRAVFPAFAFAWKLHEESFYAIPWMNQLKVRLSWGKNGNREIGSYSALAQLGSVLSYDGSSVETGVYNTSLSNPKLRWERTESFNVGFDISLFNNRVDMSIDAYDAKTHDLLLRRQLPKITGFASIYSNLGVLENRGLEATISSVNISGQEFIWRSSLVFSMNRNKIKELWGNFGDYKLLNKERNGELPDFENQWFPGYARDIVWNYERIGIWQLNEKEEAAKYGVDPGDYKVTDVNKDDKYTQFEDKKFIGYTAPRYRLGFRNEFNFLKDFSAALFFRADLGHIREVPVMWNRSTHDRLNDWAWGYWSPENPGAKFARNVFPDNWGRYGGGLRVFEPTGFLRLQDVTIAYTVPVSILQNVLSVQSLRVMLTGRNVLTFTKCPGFDPESGLTTPMPKTVTLGIDITL
ncbi:MAG: SusC/RagA family TonB-linked outer membrane protein [Fermentimonas sp.]